MKCQILVLDQWNNLILRSPGLLFASGKLAAHGLFMAVAAFQKQLAEGLIKTCGFKKSLFKVGREKISSLCSG